MCFPPLFSTGCAGTVDFLPFLLFIKRLTCFCRAFPAEQKVNSLRFAFLGNAVGAKRRRASAKEMLRPVVSINILFFENILHIYALFKMQMFSEESSFKGKISYF